MRSMQHTTVPSRKHLKVLNKVVFSIVVFKRDAATFKNIRNKQRQSTKATRNPLATTTPSSIKNEQCTLKNPDISLKKMSQGRSV